MPLTSPSMLSMPSFPSSQVKVPTSAQEARRIHPRRKAGNEDDAANGTGNQGVGQHLLVLSISLLPVRLLLPGLLLSNLLLYSGG
jgi:hypothetical protein